MTTSRTSYRAAGRPPRRRRALFVLPLFFTMWVALEVVLVILVGRAAGPFTVVLLLLAGLVIGAVVTKRAGRRAWRGLSGASSSSDDTAEPRRSDAGFLMIGGVLLAMPGLASDVVALVFLLPPTRALLRRRAERYVDRHATQPTHPLGGVFQQAKIHRPDGKVVPGEVVDRDDTPPRN